MTSSFSDKGRAAVLDRSAEISRSEIFLLKYISRIKNQASIENEVND